MTMGNKLLTIPRVPERTKWDDLKPGEWFTHSADYKFPMIKTDNNGYISMANGHFVDQSGYRTHNEVYKLPSGTRVVIEVGTRGQYDGPYLDKL